MKYPPVKYHDYLELDKILSAQKLRSEEFNKKASDEHLFIVVHQTYELWFSQILYDVGEVLNIFRQPKVDETKMNFIVSKLERVVEIQRLIIQQFPVLETMTPLDFLDFREFLYPASGFQSFQFRLLENHLGLLNTGRLTYNNKAYNANFPEDQKQKLQESENEASLFDCIEKWLERMPFINIKDFNFWESYKSAVTKMFDQEKLIISNNTSLGPEAKKANITAIENTQSQFSDLFDENSYSQLKKEGLWRLSHKAIPAALLIQLYRDQPVFQQPFRLIQTILNIDENLTHWRQRHALMAQRMLGQKVGTGGSSGAEYLKASAKHHKIFSDFFQLTTFFIPKSQLPELPKEIRQKMDFAYRV